MGIYYSNDVRFAYQQIFYDNCVLQKKKIITNSFIKIIIQYLLSNGHPACAIISCPLNHLPYIFLQLTSLKIIWILSLLLCFIFIQNYSFLLVKMDWVRTIKEEGELFWPLIICIPHTYCKYWHLQVFGEVPASEMTEKFGDVLQFCSHLSKLMVTEIRRRASNQSTGR